DISVSTLSSCLVATTRGDRLACDAPRHRRLQSPDRLAPPRHPWGLRGSSDVVCGIPATMTGGRPQNGLWNPQIIGIQIVNFGTNRNRNRRVYNSLTNSAGRFHRLWRPLRFDFRAWGHAAAACLRPLPAPKRAL